MREIVSTKDDEVSGGIHDGPRNVAGPGNGVEGVVASYYGPPLRLALRAARVSHRISDRTSGGAASSRVWIVCRCPSISTVNV